jgi:hypothetical protein
MKTKNTNNQQPNKTSAKPTRNKAGNKNCSKIPFYITMVSITAIFCLLFIYFLDKKEKLSHLEKGFIQKVEAGKVIWAKPCACKQLRE